MTEARYRRDIQVLRGLALLAVVLFHANESCFPLGYLGVDVFFVISGFVVTPLIVRIITDQVSGRGRLSNLTSFYKRRFYRLAPALAVTLAISAISIFLLGPIADHQKFARQGIAALLLAGNFSAYRYSGDYFLPNPNPLIHTWSLSVEGQIYIFLPLILILILHNSSSLQKIIAVVLGVTALSFVSFLFPMILEPLYSRAGIEFADQFSFYSPINRIWQFTAGSLIYLLLDRHDSRIRKIPKGIQLLTIIAIAMILFGPSHMNLQVSSILASFIAVIVILFKSLEVLPNFLIQKLEWVGNRSYSIYLVHMPLLYLAKYSPLMQIGTGENRMMQSVVAVGASILLGALSYSKIENRFRDRGKIDTRGFKFISTAMVLTFGLPLFFFISMYFGNKVQYLGLDRNSPQPTVAWQLDSKCNRMSDLHQLCLYEITDSTGTVLLIGDSHAAHISQAVVDAAKREHWSAGVWTKPGCHVQFQRQTRDQVSVQCLRRNQEILKWVRENKPDAIIVSQFVHSDSSLDDLRNALFTLYSIVPNILLVENNPIFPDEKDFMISRPLIMPPYKPPRVFKQSMMQTKDKNASNQLANWARENNISTINFDSLFCKSDVCTRFSNQKWLYYDDDHFSVAGAKLTIPLLVEFLRRS